MGGHLLHYWNLPEKRVPRAEFDRIIEEVIAILRSAYPNRRVEPLKFFAEKQDFGDLDVAFEMVSGEAVDWQADILRLFGFKAHKNGNCVSFPYDGFQVDILTFGQYIFDTAQIYYAYESGNFMGRIADKMGLSYGHRGLYLQVPLDYFGEDLPKDQYKEILVSRHPEEIFRLLGFDYNRFLDGFNNFEEMSEWVADSLYFSPEVFAFESLNSINRTRNKKRPVYAKFVEWCESQPKRDAMPSKKEVRENIIAKYRSVEFYIDEAREELVRNAFRRKKFNGNLVQELRGISGKELGAFIVDFKNSFGSFDEWLDDNTIAAVRDSIIKHIIK